MNRFTGPVLAFLAMGGLLLLISCTKTIDTSKDSIGLTTSDDLTFPTTNEFANCKLRRIYQAYPDNVSVITGVFTYNPAGNPVSLIYNHYDVADHTFTYDKLGRMRYYNAIGDFEFEKHAYSYDAGNRVLTDTLSRGWNSVGRVDQVYISTFTYDTQGRIIKENIRNTLNTSPEGQVVPLEPTRNPTFTYDARGNLAVAGWKSSSYDNKPSIFRTHPVFQFIHRNYSKNNSSVQAKYNSKGLPLAVVPGNDTFFELKNVTKAIYDCQ